MRRAAPARVLLALLAAAAAGCASSKPTETVGAQLAFGVQMAERGLWSEALFRFQQAHRLDPGDARILNNLAVSYEAVGRFDEALATYRQALEAAPDNRRLRQNYTRFLEFYQSFHPPKPAPAAAPPGGRDSQGGGA